MQSHKDKNYIATLKKDSAPRLTKNNIDHVPTTQLHYVRHSLELLDLTNTNLSNICTSEFYPMTFLKKLFINDIQFLSKIEKYAFDSLEKLEFLEMKNNPLLDFIDPKAFYDAKMEVYYSTSYLPNILYFKMFYFLRDLKILTDAGFLDLIFTRKRFKKRVEIMF